MDMGVGAQVHIAAILRKYASSQLYSMLRFLQAIPGWGMFRALGPCS